MSRYFAGFFLLMAFLTNLVFSASWTYEESDQFGPDNWGFLSPKCDGHRQSPININSVKTVRALDYTNITILNIRKQPTEITYSNNGHGVTISFTFQDGIQPKLSGGPLNGDTYNFHSIHFHWKSEHTVNYRQYEAEAHFVHWNSKYGSFTTASLRDDGIAVLGFLYTIPTFVTQEKPFGQFFKGALNVRDPGNVYLEKTDLYSIFDLIQSENFYVWSYLGSLTTPDCNEAVTWMVSKRALAISSLEVQALKLIKNQGGPMAKTNRPIQPLLGRQVTDY